MRDPDEVRVPLTERARRAEAERDETAKRNIILKARLDDINHALPEWSDRPILTRIEWLREQHAEVRKAIEAQYRELKAKYDAEKARADRLAGLIREWAEAEALAITEGDDGRFHAARAALIDVARGTVAPSTVEVYTRPECIFAYCPAPESCRKDGQCASPRSAANGGGR